MRRIDHIALTSLGGYAVTITAMAPGDRDCIVGEIRTAGVGWQAARWNIVGVMQNATEACNLDMGNARLVELAKLIRTLRSQ